MVEPTMQAYLKGKGKGGKSSGKGFGRRMNPMGKDGRRMRCRKCGAEDHFEANCTQSAPGGAPPSFFVTDGPLGDLLAASDRPDQEHTYMTTWDDSDPFWVSDPWNPSGAPLRPPTLIDPPYNPDPRDSAAVPGGVAAPSMPTTRPFQFPPAANPGGLAAALNQPPNDRESLAPTNMDSFLQAVVLGQQLQSDRRLNQSYHSQTRRAEQRQLQENNALGLMAALSSRSTTHNDPITTPGETSIPSQIELPTLPLFTAATTM